MSVVKLQCDEDNKQQNRHCNKYWNKENEGGSQEKAYFSWWNSRYLATYKENTSFLKSTVTHKITTLPDCLSNTVQMH